MNAESSQVGDMVDMAQRHYSQAPAHEVLEWVDATFGGRWTVASSMQDAVLIDLAAQVKPDVDVVFLETGYHFAETLGTRDAVEAVYPRVRIRSVRPEFSVAEQDAAEGERLYERAPDRCCHLRKVLPLRSALVGYDAWVTGLRRVDGPGRADTPVVEWDERHGLVKVNPIAAWSDEELQRYIDERGILVNPLMGEGYTSIGCAPCTVKPLPGADLRSGRWAGLNKTECGLHGGKGKV
ncbi:phosphoadenylyl-sulfate reductase [Streptomyces pinistramenti]|uniref:phosphoadenylyl-sulfate reductase n=1 Tax=Streptomyces pinistramenti TaxID=2884812 RepID=UPI001D099461|nr:phosphoadenylyl-sulfate reductase [Streptomyces pinistramenti]MCB5907517.1 phosphoadenylyl-sulfate reductase [Streptomyces pinistramenti]